MDVRFWGPHFWATMEFVAFHYPVNPSEEDKTDIKNFYNSLIKILPCNTCQEHFQKLLVKFPLDNHLSSRDELTRWLVEAHNRVNDRLGKPRIQYSVVHDKYEQMKGTCEMGNMISSSPSVCPPSTCKGSNKWLLLSFLLVISVTIIFVIICWKKKQSCNNLP